MQQKGVRGKKNKISDQTPTALQEQKVSKVIFC